MAMANKLFYGDNLALLRESIPTESVEPTLHAKKLSMGAEGGE